MIREFSNQFTLQLKKLFLGSVLVVMAVVLGACSDDTTNGDGGTTHPVVSPSFDLGKDFTITSLDGAKFIGVSEKPLEYNVAEIIPNSKEVATIQTELTNAITQTLNKDTITFGKIASSGKVVADGELTVTIPTTIKDKEDTTKTKTESYIFTIGFTKELVKWDGSVTAITPTTDGVYQIDNGSHLAWIAEQTRLATPNTFANKTVRFMNSVDMDNKTDDTGANAFTGINEFAGRLEGNHKTIYGLKLGLAEDGGLIAVLNDGGYIDNLTIAKGGSIESLQYAGAFVVGTAPNATVTIKGVTNHATVAGSDSVGGLVGMIVAGSTLTISNSSNTGTVTGSDNVGGLVGGSEDGSALTISNSSNIGNITGRGTSVGGLVGGSTTGSTLAISNSSNIGNVTGKAGVGGLVGKNDLNSTLTISNSSNIGKITGKEAGVGGLVGLNLDGLTLTIDNSSNIGNVTGLFSVGGLVGESDGKTVTITNSHSYAKSVTETTTEEESKGAVGGIVGLISQNETLTANNVYWLHDTSATAGEQGIELAVGTMTVATSGTLAGNSDTNKLTIAQFKEQGSFKTWDFSTVWEILANGLYPTLKK